MKRKTRTVPLAGFFWAHMGWMLVKMEDMETKSLIEQYAKDIVRDPLYAWIEWRKNWKKIATVSWAAYFAAGYGAIALSGGSAHDAAQFGASFLVWGAALRTVVVWHLTFSVNSVTHVWGYRNYGTPDVSRNNALIALVAAGEGWHNNHHADSALGAAWPQVVEIDQTWLVIRFLMLLGLARNVAVPSPSLAAKLNAPGRRHTFAWHEPGGKDDFHARPHTDAGRTTQLLEHG